MWKLISTLIMLLLTLGTFITTLVNALRLMVTAIQKKDTSPVFIIVKKNLIVFGSLILVIGLFIWITQITAYTPRIKDANGKSVEGSIAELRKVTLNGRDEWITIRGYDKTAPVLLFLAGGPGGSQLAAVRSDLGELEKHFVVVNWDQPGSAKSYRFFSKQEITVQTYIEDGIVLTELLRDEFKCDKIFLVGESWGSALGIFLANEKPEYYEGFIGTGQMVDFAETERIDYHTAMELAIADNDTKLINKLTAEGEPPYYTGNIGLRSRTYLGRLDTYMAKHPDKISNPFHTLQDLGGAEYGVLDAFKYAIGLMNTFNSVYPQLYETDLRTQYNRIEIPVYFFLGSFDVNAPVSLVEDYYTILDAPVKEIVWFEHSGHTPWTYETDRFVSELLVRFKGRELPEN